MTVEVGWPTGAVAHRCSHCGRALLTPTPRECVKCHRPMCHPEVRDCGFAHWARVHGPRRVVEVKGP